MSKKASAEYARERRMRSLDTIRVHNPTSEDFVFWDDKVGPSRQKIIVPKIQKDIGSGKGNNDILRYLAKRFARNIIVQEITKISDKDWEEKKKQYRTRDEMIQHADREQIRTNDYNYWYQYIPHRKNLDQTITNETTLEELIERETAFRKKNNIKVKIKTLVWWGVMERYGGDEIEEQEDLTVTEVSDPFKDV